MNRFTLITRPYLLEDLQRATSGILELLESYLGSYEGDEQSEPFRKIVAFTDGLGLDQDFFYEVSKVLSDLASVGLSQAEQKQLETFRTMIGFLLEWPEQTGGTVLLNSGRHMDELLKDTSLKVKVNHPRLECYTLPLKKSPDMDTYWIAKESYWQSFRSNPPSNLLYLNSPTFRNCDFIDFVFGRNRLRARYQKLLPHEAPLEFPKSPYHQANELSGCFFKEVKVQNQTGESGTFVKDLYLNAYSDEGEFESYETVGWLNPLILTFDTMADDLPLNETEATTRATQMLSLFSNPDLLIAAEPHMNQADSYRIELLQRFAAKQQTKRQAQSLLEYILWGSHDAEPWKTFFVLDKLGGEFVVKDFGKTRLRLFDQRPERPSLVWKAPAEMFKNSIWLRNFIFRTSQLAEDTFLDRPEDILTSSVMPGHSSGRGFRRLNIKITDTNEPAIFTILDSLPKSSLVKTVTDGDEKTPGQATEKNLETLLAWIHAFLKDIYKQASLNGTQTYLGEGSYQVLEDGSIQFDELSFLEGFARHYLTPESPIYVVLPLIEKESKIGCIDIIKSVPYGHKELLRRLFAASEMDNSEAAFDEVQMDVIYQYAWWQEWFELLFNREWNIEINFISERDGFMLMKSKLSQARLGRTIIGNTYEVENMRI
jgi:hypothetical protein